MTRLTALVAALLLGFALTPTAAGTFAEGFGWTTVKQKTSGDWAIIQEDGRYYVTLGDNFSARNAPDLKIFLSTESANDRNNRNGLDGATFIAKLDSVSGAQRYALPEGVDPADFASLIIYCEQFSKLWAATTL